MRHIDYLYEQFVLLRHRHFGASTEQSSDQARLFDEAEALAAASTPEQDQATIPAPTGNAADAGPGVPDKPRRGKRAPLPGGLPRVDVVHDVPQAERTCACGTPMVEIGEDISEQLDIVPMQVRVLRHIHKRYGCRGSEHAPVVAALPAQPLPRSHASPDLLAMLLTVKYADGLSLARFEYVLERAGVAVPRQTLARWVIGAAGVLQPLHNLIRDELFNSPVLHMDETVVQVLREPGKSPTSQSYMWVQTGGPPERPVVVFDYDPSRSGAVPVRLLEGYQGYLMTDVYERLPFAQAPCVQTSRKWVADVYPGLLQSILPLRLPMKSADSRLTGYSSSTLSRSFRFGESWSYLSCHHTRSLRNLSTFTT